MAVKNEIAGILEAVFPLFEKSLKERLSELCSLKTFEPGSTLMQTGQYFKNTLLVVDGRIKLYREGEEGEEYFMYYLGQGNACALSMICATKQEKSMIMAKAIERTTVLMIPIVYMDELMKDYKSWYYFVLETYRARFEELLEVIDSIAFKSMDERLEFYLKNQTQKLQTRQLNLTHQEIAGDLSSSREVISRLLKKMEQRGLVKLHRNYIELI